MYPGTVRMAKIISRYNSLTFCSLWQQNHQSQHVELWQLVELVELLPCLGCSPKGKGNGRSQGAEDEDVREGASTGLEKNMRSRSHESDYV